MKGGWIKAEAVCPWGWVISPLCLRIRTWVRITGNRPNTPQQWFVLSLKVSFFEIMLVIFSPEGLNWTICCVYLSCSWGYVWLYATRNNYSCSQVSLNSTVNALAAILIMCCSSVCEAVLSCSTCNSDELSFLQHFFCLILKDKSADTQQF